jgi:hypothetical protein
VKVDTGLGDRQADLRNRQLLAERGSRSTIALDHHPLKTHGFA